MPHIRPISDLRNKFAEISKIVHDTAEPVFLTKNGHGNMVVMSIEAYEQRRFDSELYLKLKEAEIEAKTCNKRYKHHEVIKGLKEKVPEPTEKYDV